MEQLLPWVERELKLLRRRGGELALRYPRLAGSLGAGGSGSWPARGATQGAARGDLSGAVDMPRDPHVDRLIQAAAVLHARIAHSLDRASPLLDEALLEALYPGQLQPFPSCAVFRLAGEAKRGTVLVARGTDGHSYRFRLLADAAGCTVRVGSVHWRPYAGPERRHVLSIGLEGAVWCGGRLRLFVDAEPALRAALQDALLMHADGAWAEGHAAGAGERSSFDAASSHGSSLRASLADFTPGLLASLSKIPFGVAGYGEIGDHGWQVLRAYQCFADRFNFLELDLPAVLRYLPTGCGRVTLHVAVNTRTDSELAHALARVQAANLLTGCAPAANLFPAAASPVDVTGLASEYGLQPAERSHVICSVDSVHLLRGRALEALRPEQTARFADRHAAVLPGTWTVRRALADEAGPPMRIVLAPAQGRDSAQPGEFRQAQAGEAAVASVALTCCDRLLPAGFASVELMATGRTARGAAAVAEVTGVAGVTEVAGTVGRLYEVPAGRALRWRLLSLLALEARAPDLEGLRQALGLQDLPGQEAGQKLQAALADVQLRQATLAMRHRHGSAPIDGTEIRVSIDQRALAGTSVAVFVHVLDQYLSGSVHLNTFMQLVAICAESGEELMRCRPRNGNLIL